MGKGNALNRILLVEDEPDNNIHDGESPTP